MSAISHSSLRLAFGAAAALLAAACASAPTPPPVAAAPPSQAFQQASSGVTAPQGDDGVVFVEQEHKSPTVHGDDTPITNLNANQQTARPKR